MSGSIGILLFIIALVGVSVLSAGVLMWVAALLHWRVAMIVGSAAVLFLVFSAGQVIVGCSAAPVIVPPAPDAGGEGRVIHACDGPGAMMIYAYAAIMAPLAGLTVAFGMLRVWQRRPVHG